MIELTHKEMSIKGGKARWCGTTKEERKKAMSKVLKKRWTPESRKAWGAQMAALRKAKKLSTGVAWCH